MPQVYGDKEQTSKMRKAAMVAGTEFTWSNAALQYEAVFEDFGVISAKGNRVLKRFEMQI